MTPPLHAASTFAAGGEGRRDLQGLRRHRHRAGPRERHGQAGAPLCQEVQQEGLCRSLQHEHRHGAPRLSAADRLLRLQPAGGRSALLGRLRASRPQPDGSGTGPERPQRQHSQHGGDHGRSGCCLRPA